LIRYLSLGEVLGLYERVIAQSGGKFYPAAARSAFSASS
jgi:hypothetical protein